MATPNTDLILTSKPLATGGVLVADKGTALPTDATTALLAGFRALGYVSEDGLTQAIDRSTDKIRAWGGDTVKVVQSEFAVTYSFTLLQSADEDVLKTVYGADNVTVTDGDIAIKINGETLPKQVFAFEMKDGDNKVRIVVPDGQVTEVGEVTFVDEGVISYECTVEAFKDSATNANALMFITAA